MESLSQKNVFIRLNDFITTNNPCGSECYNNLDNQNLCFRMKGAYLQMRGRKFLSPTLSANCTVSELTAWRFWLTFCGGSGESLSKGHFTFWWLETEWGKWLNNPKLFTQENGLHGDTTKKGKVDLKVFASLMRSPFFKLLNLIF